MWWIVSLVTLVVFIPLMVAEAFLAMVLANGYMGNTDPMAISYLICQAGGVLLLSLLSGLLAKILTERFSMPLWASGIAMVIFSAIIQLGVSVMAFFTAITFFAP